jgi:predicted DNA binding CopG/RHH family protein
MMKKLKKIPKFKSEADERKFWLKNDTADYFDWSKAKRVTFPNLKPSVRSISLRLPETMLHDLKVIANKKDIPYQSLMKIFIAEKIKDEHSR